MSDRHPSSGDSAPADWATLAGAPATAESLTALTRTDPSAMTGAALVDAIVASEKALSLLSGTQMRLLTALAVPFVAGDPMRLAAALARKSCITGDDDPDQVAHYIPEAAASLASAEVAAALRIPCRTAGIRVADAGTMTGALAPTLTAMEQGVLDRAKARVIADHCRPLTPDQTQDLQDLVLPDAGALTTTELRDVAGQAVIIVDPDGAEHRHQEAAARRDLAMQPGPDGMATLKAHLPADGAVKIFQVTDLLATGTAGTPGDPRGIGARRVDALVDIADHLLTHGFVDLTDYLGTELPDHGTPTPRTGRANTGRANTSTSTAEETGAPNTGDTASVDTDIVDTAIVDRATSAEATPATTEAAPEPAADAADTDLTDEADTTSTATADTTGAAATTDTDGETATAGAATTAAATNTDADATVPTGAGETATTAGAAAKVPAATRRGGNQVFTRQGRRPHLSVTIGLSTLAGLDNLPGSLAGFGAIPAGLARSIAKSAATINALITDPDTGKVTAAGALTYRPTQELRDQIAALCTVCQFPSCRQPVWRCDMDHRAEFNHEHPDQGGETNTRMSARSAGATI